MIKLDISKITIDDLDITHNDIEVITLAKVGTTIFSSSLKKGHTHGLNVLQYLLDKNDKKLIISGIRNPLDRNISFFFESFDKDESEPIIFNIDNENEYIQNTFLCYKNEIDSIEINDLIDVFKNKDYVYHNHFTIWLQQFFEMTKINSIPFDKEKGIQLYKADNDTYYLFYVLEKYRDNKETLEKFLKISLYDEQNVTNNKDIAKKYKDFKANIILDYSYKDSLLNTSVIKYFYSDDLIQKFYSLY